MERYFERTSFIFFHKIVYSYFNIQHRPPPGGGSKRGTICQCHPPVGDTYRVYLLILIQDNNIIKCVSKKVVNTKKKKEK